MLVQVLFDLPMSRTWTYLVPEKLQPRLQPFTRVIADLAGEQQVGLVVDIQPLPEKWEQRYELKPILRLIDRHRLLNDEQYRLAARIAEYYFSSLGEAVFSMIPGGRREKSFLPELAQTGEITLPPLNADQQKVIDQVIAPGNRKGVQTHLVYGVTGSGKTRIYLEIAREYLSRGQGVIFLLPEIALSYQFLDQLKPMFGEQLAFLHSGLNRAHRLSEYRRVLDGKARLVVGTRSAVFSPVHNLSLVILDEEHDNSYKEHASPRYNAKRVAYMRLEAGDCSSTLPASLILGSATPSAESYQYASQHIFYFHRLRQRATGMQAAEIHLPLYHKDMGPLSLFLKEKMEYHLYRGNQIILLMNRRGHSNFALCENCEQTLLCRHCSVSLTYHRSGDLVCHLCGHQEPYSGRCPECHGKLTLCGTGTQKVEEVLERHFPEVPFARLDQDVARTKDYARDILEDMRRGKIRILLGTQMIAKGFDLPGVTLVGILNADQGLSLPDFRAGERVFQLLVQAAGRAGRHKKGEVVMQTMLPQHPAVRAAATGDYDAFYADELLLRKQAGYPPFARMFRLLLRSPDEQLLQSAAQRIAGWLHSELTGQDLFSEQQAVSPAQILGPVSAPLEKIKDEYRMHLLIKDPSAELVHGSASRLVRELESGRLKTGGVRWEADMDPVDLL